MFKVRGYANPLAGYGLVLGANLTNGKSIDCTFCAEKISPQIRFERGKNGSMRRTTSLN
jgi:hypothetical protein